MPTLFRLLFVLGLIVAIVYGTMWSLATFLHPSPHEITQNVKLPSLKP